MNVLWSFFCVAIGLVIAPLVFPQIDRLMHWLKERRR